jgi:hypothetical protein
MNRSSRVVSLILFASCCVVGLGGCSSNSSRCRNGMCEINGVALTESQVRERASRYAYRSLEFRQDGRAPLKGPDNKPIVLEEIDSELWQVLRIGEGWHLTRYVTRDLW